MNPLSRVAGQAVDRMLGLPAPAVPYLLRRDVPVAMPDRVVLLPVLPTPAPPAMPAPH